MKGDAMRSLLRRLYPALAVGVLVWAVHRTSAQAPAESPAGQAAARTSAIANQLNANQKLQTERETRRDAAIRDVDKSGLSPQGDMELPGDWKKKIRNPVDAQPMTAKERSILRAMDAPISIRFRGALLKDVIDEIQSLTGQTIVLDGAAVEAAGVSYDSTVSLNVKNLSLRSVIRRLARDLGLGYVIKDETIQLVTVDKAREMMVTRTYYVGDLAPNRRRAAQLIRLIEDTIDPQSWRENGGQGTIVYHEATGSIVIKQTAEFHSVLSGSSR
jgi:hypothetical protein